MSKPSVLGITYELRPANDAVVRELKTQFDVPEIVAQLLAARGIAVDMAESFLTPTIKDLLPDPHHLIDMDKAVSRLIAAMESGEQMAVFGDYDVDGATSSALLFRTLKQLGHPLEIYIPNRLTEGYGPTIGAMGALKDNGAKVVITVDCGAVAFEAIKHATEIGLEVIVVDHHIGAEELPDAVAVINPNRLDESSDYGYLAAVGVTFLLCVALVSELAKREIIDTDKARALKGFLLQQLDLVALGTVCDVMPLTGLNRAYVAQGLQALRSRNNLGLRKLMDVARVNQTPTAYHLGFALGPRINAGGRIGESGLGARLLTTHDEAEAERIARELDRLNDERRAIEQNTQDEATEQAARQTNQSLLFVSDAQIDSSWHAGVIGIVASRLKDRFDLPAAVIATEDHPEHGRVGKGSMRSVRGADVGAALLAAKADGLLIAGGGHAMAGGFTVATDKMEALMAFLDKQLSAAVTAYRENTTRELDLALPPSAISLDLLDQLKALEPYGVANREPRILLEGAKVADITQVGENHLRLQLTGGDLYTGNKRLTAMAFRALDSELGTHLLSAKNKVISLVGKANENHWNDRITPQFIIDDTII